jgi:hypothetical protein
MADPDYGDITDPTTGRDITVEIVSAEDSGTSYPVTTIRVKPKETPLVESAEETKKFLTNQMEITDLYQELTYSELKSVLEGWLNPSATGDDELETSVSAQTLSSTASPAESVIPAPTAKAESHDMGGSQPAPAKKLDDVTSAFDDLFNN